VETSLSNNVLRLAVAQAPVLVLALLAASRMTRTGQAVPAPA